MNDLPEMFWNVPYDGKCSPGSATGLEEGANCQHYAYEVLRYLGFEIGNMFSSELFEDEIYTEAVDHDAPLKPWDLLLFGKTQDSYGAHLGIFMGEGRVLHLCKEVGVPVVWKMEEFQKRSRYAVVVGIKRPVKRAGLEVLLNRSSHAEKEL